MVFQAGDLIKPHWDFLQDVDHDIREQHAQELLGSSFNESLAARLKDAPNMSVAIRDEFRARLPKAYKWQATALANLVIQDAEANELDPVFVMAVIAQESSFRPTARGPVGEIGLMQLRPATAAWIAEKNNRTFYGPQTLENPYYNIKLGITYLGMLRSSFKNEASSYVSAYNMGSGKVRRMVASQTTPTEYSSKILKRYADLYTSLNKKTMGTAPTVKVAQIQAEP